jgi:hypothetical protein
LVPVVIGSPVYSYLRTLVHAILRKKRKIKWSDTEINNKKRQSTVQLSAKTYVLIFKSLIYKKINLMKLACLKRIVIGLILSNLLLNSFSQGIEKKTYHTSFTKTAPEIDGLMNDECWNLVEWGGDFIQTQPYENRPPTQETIFKILYDDNNLYVFIRAYDKEPDKISRIMTRRDYFRGDMVEINIDSYFDKQTAFSFTAMASGAKGDEAITRNGNNWDDSWNPIWFLKTSIDDEGWSAEMRIPFSQLRFGNKDEHIWGLQFMRHIYREEERSRWQFIPKGSPGIVHLFGELHGIRNIKLKHQVEILPYVVGKVERFEKVDGNPFLDGKSSNLSAGIDGKIGLTNDLTLDFTINPDFGQVEADPSVVNLTAFETYFSERRPFFIEGKNIYEFRPSQSIVIHKMQSDNLFYSRRIGRSPHIYPSTTAGENVEMPEATTILASTKLSGKTKKGLSLGFLESVTAEEKAVIDNEGIRREEPVEPLTNYFVGRLQQDFNKGETVLGGMITAVNRNINDPVLYNLHSAAYTAGINFQHNWKERTWYVSANAEFSNVKGKEEAIITTQRSSARYYQRPDADYMSVDSSLTSLSGYGGTVKFGKSSQKRLQFETSITVRSPGLEFNDIGYMKYSDLIHHGTWAGYYLRNPFAIFNNFYLNMNYWMYWNFSGKLTSTSFNVNFNSQFKNRWRINGSITRQTKNTSTTLLRGGPSFLIPGDIGMNLNLQTDNSKKVFFYIGNYHDIGDEKYGTYHEYWGGSTIRPISSLSISIGPEYGIQANKLQYVQITSMNNDPKYLFAELDQKTLSFTFRINYTINPELSVEYYGQPFVSAGRYSNFKKITDTDADEFSDRYHIFTNDEISFNSIDNKYIIDENSDGTEDYALGNPDFNFRQFRSNLVVRWEYSPGSTLYLVWSQGRTSFDSNGVFSYGSDMKDLFGIVPHNVFLLKFSYWFSL